MPRRVHTLALLLSGLAVSMSAGQRPTITKGDTEPVLVLPDAMQQALHRFDRDFVPRQLIDYLPLLWRPGCVGPATCAESLYRTDPRQAPFAVAGFFDADDIMDVMIDGDNRAHGRRLVLTTGPTGVVVTEIEKIERIPTTVVASRAERGRWRDWTDGVRESLSFVRAATYKSALETEPLALTADAVLVTRTDGGTKIYYHRDGAWRQFVVAK